MDETRGMLKEKLIRAKERWAREGRLLTGKAGDPERERIPPGQREVRDFPVLDLGVVPRVRPETWRLDIGGHVERPLSWSWAEFKAQPQVEIVSDIHCVTAWSRLDNRWAGVAARHMIESAKPKPDSRHVILHSLDGYTTNVPLPVFAGEDVLLAHAWEGEPLAPEHGGPVRVVIPRLYFWKSAKWLARIEFVAQDAPGFWEVRGYHNEGDPWQEERYGSPKR
ncbi:MAG TPA: sulfite oxidase-like oxidoreductase [Alphaproteobacteria bacterium]|nr:sulfite oxidase-like oxidoreductase [Alphaproteobacteria bacterium]